MHRLSLMTGADTFLVRNRGVQFSFKGCRKANRVTIDLTPADTYTVRFWKVTSKSVRMVDMSQDVYSDRLIPLFEEVTGLYLTV